MKDSGQFYSYFVGIFRRYEIRVECLIVYHQTYRYLIPYFAGTSEMCSRLACLKLEACDLSCGGVNHLLDSLPVLNGTLKSLSIAENCLGRFVCRVYSSPSSSLHLNFDWFFICSKVAGPLGRFLSTPIEVLDASGIDLLPSGFLELQNMLTIEEELSLVTINIRLGLILYILRLLV